MSGGFDLPDLGTQPDLLAPAEDDVPEVADDDVNFHEGKVGAVLRDAVPLLHVEVHDMLRLRQNQQKRWCDDLQVLGVLRGLGDSYTNWTMKQAPFIGTCFQYSGVGSSGVGQAQFEDASTFAPALSRWTAAKEDMLVTDLAYTPEHCMGNNIPDNSRGRMHATEVATLCNLAPENSEEACAILPELIRFTKEDIDRECERIIRAGA